MAAGGVIGWLLVLPTLGAEPAERPVPVVDLHVDLSYQSAYRGRSFDEGTGQFVAKELLRDGVLGVVLPLFVPHDVSPRGPRLADLEWSYARLFGNLAQSRPYQLPGCRPEGGRVQTWLAFEGAGPLADQPAALTAWVARGVRLLGLVHAEDDALATSAGMRETVRNTSLGLTPAGRELVHHAHALGIPVDVSHASDAATDEVLALSRAAGVPVVATHSGARAVHAHARNLTDAQVRAIAATGGVVGVGFHSAYLAGGRAARIGDVVRHVQHLVRLVGADYVAIGSDFEGGIRPPPGLEGTGGYQRLARALLDAGLSHADVEKVFSGNALRVLCHAPGPGSPGAAAAKDAR
jgi:membrane dipeptidase